MNKSSMVAAIAFLLSPIANAFTPWQGHWLNWNEPGSGYNMTIQNGTLMMMIFSYKTTGDSEWYMASGPLTADGTRFDGTLMKYRNGQCIGCSFGHGPSEGGSDGAIAITFHDETSATVSLPNGRTTNIVPFNFGQGVAPEALLGEWLYTYDLFGTYANRYDFIEVIPGTPNGDGMAYDPARLASCELKVRGDPSMIGLVFCVELNQSGTRINSYVYRYGIEQTYDGFWVSKSDAYYPMKGFLIYWKNFQSKRATRPGAAVTAPPDAQSALDLAKTLEDVAFQNANAKLKAKATAPSSIAFGTPAQARAVFDEMASRIRDAAGLQ